MILMMPTLKNQYEDQVNPNVTECLVNGPVSFEYESLGALARPALKVQILRGDDAILSICSG